jgi:hypothetical protein
MSRGAEVYYELDRRHPERGWRRIRADRARTLEIEPIGPLGVVFERERDDNDRRSYGRGCYR